MAVITISRQFGAGGITLGRMVAQQLGYKFYDHEIIQMVAKRAKVSTRWVQSMEKEAGGKMERLISGLVSKTFMDRFLDDNRRKLEAFAPVFRTNSTISGMRDGGSVSGSITTT